MSYIDNKSSLIRELHILQLENELLRTQIKKLQNELLDCTKSNDEQTTLQQTKTRKSNNK